MARIVITTFGSPGDLHPYLALGLDLRERGHDVLFAVEDSFRSPLEAQGFAVHHLSGDAEAMLGPYEREMFGRTTPFPSLEALLNHYILPTLPAKVEELRAACAGANLLVASAAHFAASFIANLTGIPYATVALSPAVASAYLQPTPQAFALPDMLQTAANRLSWALGNAVLRRIADRKVNALRIHYGLPPGGTWLGAGNFSRSLTAIAVSPALVPRPPDWPLFIRETGFLFWDTPSSWTEPPDLAPILAGDVPVIAVSSGSVGPSVQDELARFFRASVEAVRRLGARALVIGAHPGALPEPLPTGVLALPHAPFSQVYLHCVAAIHHGGIGTIGQALRAGLPALIVPWGADQPFNGTLVERAGAGRLLLRRSYTAARAERALRALLTEKRYREQAQAIAGQIAGEDGVAALCTAIKGMLTSASPACEPGTAP